jgi:hypothetical protein
MLFLIHAACGFGCGVLTMHLLTIGCHPCMEMAHLPVVTADVDRVDGDCIVDTPWT